MSSQDPRVPSQPIEGNPREETDPRAQWQRDKEDFGRRFFAHADEFLALDNRIVANFVLITDSLASYAKAHPDRVFAAEGVSGRAMSGPDDIAGGGWGEDIFNFIKDFIIADKELIGDIIRHLLGMG